MTYSQIIENIKLCIFHVNGRFPLLKRLCRHLKAIMSYLSHVDVRSDYILVISSQYKIDEIFPMKRVDRLTN